MPGYEELFEEKVDALYALYQQKREYDAALVAEEAARGAVLQHEVPPVTEPREGSPDSPLQAPKQNRHQTTPIKYRPRLQKGIQ